jgi:ceramide glucosyltransferase
VIFAASILLGCWVYCVLAIIAALRYSRGADSQSAASRLIGTQLETPISILKPLSGLDEGLEQNLRSFFEQDYLDFEILFAVRRDSDPAIRIVQALIAEYPSVSAKLIVTGESPYPNAKVFSLSRMLEEASYPLIVMSDSDIHVESDFCDRIAAEFANTGLDLVTCPYRAIGGTSIWSRLEAVGMNTDFHVGLFTAVLMEGVRFAVGPTIVARRNTLDALGGIERLKNYLAEDFMLGKIASEQGFGVRFSSYVVEHRIGSETMRANFAHRVRWARSTRRSRPAGYIGQFFTHAFPIALLTCLLIPHAWPLLVVTIVLRGVAAWIVSDRILGAKVSWLLLPVQDILAFAFWIAGFFGNSIQWRGRRYILNRDGTVEPAA